MLLLGGSRVLPVEQLATCLVLRDEENMAAILVNTIINAADDLVVAGR